MQIINADLVIKDINELLKSPYAHKQFGVVTCDDAYTIRKDFAETIIDLCIKNQKTASRKVCE